MAQQPRFTCIRCSRTFKTRPGLTVHISKVHKHPKPCSPPSTFQYHRHLTAQHCDEDGLFIESQAPPPDEDEPTWAPFQGHPEFEFAELIYKKMQCSAGDIDNLLNLWAAHNINNGGGDPVFSNAEKMYEAIDSITHGDAAWESFSVHYPGPITPNSPSWQLNTFQVHCQNTHNVVHNMLNNKDFNGKFDYVPFQEYTDPQTSRYSNLMSGQWAYAKAVSDITCHLLNINAQYSHEFLQD